MEEKEKKKGSPLMLVIVLLLVIIAGGGFFAFKTMAQAAEPKKVALPKRAVVKVGEFVTNLAGPDRRFVKVTMDMELEDEETAKELATKTSQMRDSVLLVLRSRTAGELSGQEGMKKLGSDLLEKANTILKSGRALSIYFTEFTIQ